MVAHDGTMADADPLTTEPVAIVVERADHLTITWGDGHVSRFELRPLRLACPCAGCRAGWASDREPAVPTDLAITGVELAGAWGITPTWNDGHATGIYSWAYLRAGCACPVCASAEDPVDQG